MVGCGEVNPIENDPKLRHIKPGLRILVNNAPGIVIGTGTRSTAHKPTLSLVADMHAMDPEFMGGFITSAGPEVVTSVAVPIPVIDEQTLRDLMESLDENIEAPISDISDRKPIAKVTYADLWQGRDLEIEYDQDDCINCSLAVLPNITVLPVPFPGGKRDESKCARCGACTVNCLGGAFKANMGCIWLNGKEIPIVFRQGNRFKALRLAEKLKEDVISGKFLINSAEDLLVNVFR